MKIIITTIDNKEVTFDEKSEITYVPAPKRMIEGSKKELTKHYIELSVGKTVLTFDAFELQRAIQSFDADNYI